jgi:6-phosphofructokinase 1
VLRALVMTLWYSYGVRNIKGFRYGYEGLNSKTGTLMMLTPEVVSNIHYYGGSLIGTSRGPQDIGDMIATLQKENISILFAIGGDGTLRGAHALCEEILKRQLCISVVGVPKTIDNDIPLMERTFGFSTAVERAVGAIQAAHCEAYSQPNGVALVKLMGRESGAIACEASLASGDVNLCLIPEVDFDLDCVLHYVQQRLDCRSHCVVVVAEGAGQKLFADRNLGNDASGNARLGDIGGELKKHLERSLRNPTVKYIDPSYIIRSAPATAPDEEFCVLLAQMAVHAGMSGMLECTVGYLSGKKKGFVGCCCC